MKKIWAIIWKDIITEVRTKELFSTMFTFAVLIIVIFNFAFDFSGELIPVAAPAILWVSFTFSGVLGLSRSFGLEKEGNSIMGMLLTPTDRSIIFLGKMLSNLVLLCLVELIILPAFILFFNYGLGHDLLRLLPIIFLGTLGFVSVGTLFSAMAYSTRLREVLLPILMLPVIIPVIISAVKLTTVILAGKPIDQAGSALKVLISFDILFLAVCSLVFEFVAEE